MQRIQRSPRPGWQATVEAFGFDFHTLDGRPYWDESAFYRFTADEIDTLEAAAGELERLCLLAVDRVVKEGLYDRLAIPEAARPLIAESWGRFDKNLVGRFDLSWDGTGDPKLLEYNADTPTALFEASVVQWEWLESTKAGGDQFNSVHEKLIEAWTRYGLSGLVHFTSVPDHAEDRGTVEYLRDTCTQAGLETAYLTIDQVGWDGRQFVDAEMRPIRTLGKLYPWEWLMQEAFAAHIGPSGIRMIEPAWKMLLSNKAVLALLWEMFPGHPNLLPASLDPAALKGPVVEKPILGREGEGVRIHRDATPPARPGHVYQALAPLPRMDGFYPVIGAWVIASQAAGIGIREDDQPITLNSSRFVPHCFD